MTRAVALVLVVLLSGCNGAGPGPASWWLTPSSETIAARVAAQNHQH